MKFLKILLGVIILIALSYIIYYAYGYFQYHKALKRDEDKWLNEVFKPRYFKGVIYQLDKNHEGNCFTNLIILIGEEKFASGVCLCGENESFSNFTNVGDSIIKKQSSFKVIVIKKVSGETKEFDFPFCD